jgi:hypothetical protein
MGVPSSSIKSPEPESGLRFHFMERSFEGGVMVTYRCFILDRESHISERLPIESDSDDNALIVAGAVLNRRPEMAAIEVWEGARLVQKLRQT